MNQTNASGGYDFAVTRLKADGTPDLGFGDSSQQTVNFNLGGSSNDKGRSVKVQSDGNIVVAGWAQISSAGDYDFAVARLTAEGKADFSFGDNGLTIIPFDLGPFGSRDDSAYAVAIQPADGKIVVAGYAQVTAAGDHDFAVARLLATTPTPTSPTSPTGARRAASDNSAAASSSRPQRYNATHTVVAGVRRVRVGA